MRAAPALDWLDAALERGRIDLLRAAAPHASLEQLARIGDAVPEARALFVRTALAALRDRGARVRMRAVTV